MNNQNTIFGAAITFILSLAALSNSADADVIGYWRFEGGIDGSTAAGADTILDSASTNHGTPFGDPVFTSDVPTSSIPLTGDTNSLSLDFDGTGDTVLIGTDAALNSAAPFTVEFWMNSSDASSGQKLLVDKSHGFGDSTGWFFQTGGIGQIGFGFGNGGAFPGTGSTTNFFDGNWHHIAGTYDGSTIELFVDGISQGTEMAGTYVSNTRDIRIGSARNNGRFFNGQIDEVRISDSVLSPSQFLSVPEPSSASIVAFATIGLFSRRRKS